MDLPSSLSCNEWDLKQRRIVPESQTLNTQMAQIAYAAPETEVLPEKVKITLNKTRQAGKKVYKIHQCLYFFVHRCSTSFVGPGFLKSWLRISSVVKSYKPLSEYLYAQCSLLKSSPYKMNLVQCSPFFKHLGSWSRASANHIWKAIILFSHTENVEMKADR